MNPYSRFRLISNTASAALVAGALCALWPTAASMVAAATGGVSAAYWAATAITALVSVVGWLALAEAMFPALFQLPLLRRLVLGAAYVEGTWIQAERGPSGTERLTVLHIRPAGAGVELSAYSLNREGEIESNRMIEFCKLDGPVLRYIYRSLMPDGAGGQAQGSSELMFEMGRGAPSAYAGYGQISATPRRFAVEGAKLTKWSERRKLRKLDQRTEICDQYWDLFFGAVTGMDEVDAPPTVRRPIIVERGSAEPGNSVAARAFTERRSADNAPADGVIVARRRASDWRNEDATPTADRIRARMMAETGDAEEEDLLEDEREDDLHLETELEADEDVLLDDEAEEALDDEDFEAGDEMDDEFEVDAEEESDEELDEEEEVDAEADDMDDDEDDVPDADEAPEEPVVIRQRYARR